MKIIIFGGSFNPVHNEHVAMLREAVISVGAQKVIVMPTAVSPHKRAKISAPPADRMAMCRLAFGDVAEVSPYEVDKGGTSFSYITCEHLKHLYPEDELFFLMGADMFAYFPEWVYPERILSCVTLAVCAREGSASVGSAQRKFAELFGRQAQVISYMGAAVSSTRVRVTAALGYDISSFVPKAVQDYISRQKLYVMPNLAEAQKLLKAERAAHTLRVAIMAAENCGRLNIAERTAVTAAALHDCAKNVPLNDKMLAGFTLPEGVPESVVHQFAGAYLAEHRFGVKDSDILNAIRYHTSGRADMSDLEKLIFLCDMLEEGRDFDGIDELRAVFSRDIDECLYLALKHQLVYLQSSRAEIYPLTRQAYDYVAVRYKNRTND